MNSSQTLRKLAIFLFITTVYAHGQQKDPTISATAQVRPGFGAVEGQVVDAHSGEPIAKARVMAQPDDTGSARKLQSTLSDEKGNFFLNDLSPGPYVIPAAKEEEDYPNADYVLFAGELTVSPHIVVREGQVTRDVVIRIQKGGKLAGSILDSQTRQPVLTARIRLTRADHPEWWLLTGPDIKGGFQLIVPSRPFRFEVLAPGYRTWRYSGRGTDTLLVKQESQENIPVLLEKD